MESVKVLDVYVFHRRGRTQQFGHGKGSYHSAKLELDLSVESEKGKRYKIKLTLDSKSNKNVDEKKEIIKNTLKGKWLKLTPGGKISTAMGKNPNLDELYGLI